MIRGAPQIQTIPAAEAARLCKALTDRQVDVLTLKCHGFTNKEICRHLDIEIKTVERHFNHIFKAIGARNAPAATAIAAKGGLV